MATTEVLKLGNTEVKVGSKFMVKEIAKQTIGVQGNKYVEKEIISIDRNQVTFKGSDVKYFGLYSRFGYIYFEAVSGRKSYSTQL